MTIMLLLMHIWGNKSSAMNQKMPTTLATVSKVASKTKNLAKNKIAIASVIATLVGVAAVGLAITLGVRNFKENHDKPDKPEQKFGNEKINKIIDILKYYQSLRQPGDKIQGLNLQMFYDDLNSLSEILESIKNGKNAGRTKELVDWEANFNSDKLKFVTQYGKLTYDFTITISNEDAKIRRYSRCFKQVNYELDLISDNN